MATIFDLYNPDIIATNWITDRRDTAPYFGETLFPVRQHRGRYIDMINGMTATNRVLSPSAYDVEVKPRPRRGLSLERIEMGFFKESKHLTEEDQIQIEEILKSGNPSINAAINAHVYDDVFELLDAAEKQKERMRMEALTTGNLNVTGNGQQYLVNYGLQTANVGVNWSDTANSDPYTDIENAIEDVKERYGLTPTRAVCNTVTFKRLVQSQSFKTVYYPLITGSATLIVSKQQVRDFLLSELGISIYIYDGRYVNEQGVTTKYVADGTFVLFGDTPLGYTNVGVTPEERDLYRVNQGLVSRVSIPLTGIALTHMVKPDPVTIENKVSMVTIPTFSTPENIVIIDTESNP